MRYARKNPCLPRFAVALLRSSEGATALEYAIVVPVLLLLLMGIVEYSLVMYASSVLDGATEDAARAGRTGYPDGTTAGRQAYVTQVLNGRVNGLLKPAKLIVNEFSFKTFAEAHGRQNGTPGIGDSNDVVAYTVTYPWPISTPLVSRLIGVNGIYTITSKSLVKNEPFKSASLDSTVAPYAPPPSFPTQPPPGSCAPNCPPGGGSGPFGSLH